MAFRISSPLNRQHADGHADLQLGLLQQANAAGAFDLDSVSNAVLAAAVQQDYHLHDHSAEESKASPERPLQNYSSRRNNNQPARGNDSLDNFSTNTSPDRVSNSTATRNQSYQKQLQKNQSMIEELFKCFICFSDLQEPVMCPSCSKLGCASCLKKWIQEMRPECPHCRCTLRSSQLVSCRFLDEIKAAAQTIQNDAALEKRKQENCSIHKGTNLCYFCQTCKTAICSDCAVMEDTHRGHNIRKLQLVYEEHRESVKAETSGLRKRLKELNQCTTDIQTVIERVQKSKDERCKEIESFVEGIQAKLMNQLKSKLLELIQQKNTMATEVEQLEHFQQKLNQDLFQEPQSKLIKKSADLIRQLQTLKSQPKPQFSPDEYPADFPSDLIPEFASSTFLLQDFSQHRHSEEPIYSPPLLQNGITWRLKVYPNGNGSNAHGNYISVFLEMQKGLASEPQKYEYRVEMISQNNYQVDNAGGQTNKKVQREFQSEFEVGECWGYNRFYRIDQLESEGFLNTDDDSLMLKFYVRPPSYYQMCKDQQRYVTSLESKVGLQESELETFRKSVSSIIKKQKQKSKQTTNQTLLKQANAGNSKQWMQQTDKSPSIDEERKQQQSVGVQPERLEARPQDNQQKVQKNLKVTNSSKGKQQKSQVNYNSKKSCQAIINEIRQKNSLEDNDQAVAYNNNNNAAAKYTKNKTKNPIVPQLQSVSSDSDEDDALGLGNNNIAGNQANYLDDDDDDIGNDYSHQHMLQKLSSEDEADEQINPNFEVNRSLNLKSDNNSHRESYFESPQALSFEEDQQSDSSQPQNNNGQEEKKTLEFYRREVSRLDELADKNLEDEEDDEADVEDEDDDDVEGLAAGMSLDEEDDDEGDDDDNTSGLQKESAAALVNKALKAAMRRGYTSNISGNSNAYRGSDSDEDQEQERMGMDSPEKLFIFNN